MTIEKATKPSEFDIQYGYVLEDLNMRFYASIDNASTLALYLAGASLMLPIAEPWFVGFIISTLATFSVAFKPGVKSEQSKLQRNRYAKLSLELNSDDLAKKFSRLEESDSICPCALNSPAYIRAGIMCNRDVSGEKLSIMELVAARLGGDSMRRTNN